MRSGHTRITRRALVVAFIAVTPWSCGGTTVEGSSDEPRSDGGPDGAAGNASGGGPGSGGALPESWFTCSDTRECRIWHLGCCRCNATQLVDAIAYRSEFIDELYSTVCAGRDGSECLTSECPRTPQFIVPLCIEGRCTAIDIRQSGLTACRTSDQCRLRMDTTCGQCGAGWLPPEVVAVSAEIDFEQVVCGSLPRPENGEGDECFPRVPPPGYGVACLEGRCVAIPP